MSDADKAKMYYGALMAVLAKLESHSSTADSWRESRQFLIGYIKGTAGEIPVTQWGAKHAI